MHLFGNFSLQQTGMLISSTKYIGISNKSTQNSGSGVALADTPVPVIFHYRLRLLNNI